MTQSQVVTHLVDKVGINKKQAKSTIAELTALVKRELWVEGCLMARRDAASSASARPRPAWDAIR